MKEITLRSKKNQGLCIQVLDGEFALLHDESELDPKGFITDCDTYAIELYKLLRKACELGYLKVDDFNPEEKQEILV